MSLCASLSLFLYILGRAEIFVDPFFQEKECLFEEDNNSTIHLFYEFCVSQCSDPILNFSSKAHLKGPKIYKEKDKKGL